MRLLRNRRLVCPRSRAAGGCGLGRLFGRGGARLEPAGQERGTCLGLGRAALRSWRGALAGWAGGGDGRGFQCICACRALRKSCGGEGIRRRTARLQLGGRAGAEPTASALRRDASEASCRPARVRLGLLPPVHRHQASSHAPSRRCTCFARRAGGRAAGLHRRRRVPNFKLNAQGRNAAPRALPRGHPALPSPRHTACSRSSTRCVVRGGMPRLALRPRLRMLPRPCLTRTALISPSGGEARHGAASGPIASRPDACECSRGGLAWRGRASGEAWGRGRAAVVAFERGDTARLRLCQRSQISGP